MAWMGGMFGKAGDYDRGCALIERAMQVNPAHPAGLHFTIFDRHFARGEFAESLAAAERVNIPEFMWMHSAIAAANRQLGLPAPARQPAPRTQNLFYAGTCKSGIGGAENRRRQGAAMIRAQRAERLTRALSVAMPVLAYIWR